MGPLSRPAICLLSGGMDSAVCLAEAIAEGFDVRALTIDYGQRHACELEAAKNVARAGGAREHRTIRMDLGALAGSSLTDSAKKLPSDRREEEIGAGVPSTYVPARNALFLCAALAFGEVVGASDLFIGANRIDYSGYPDCRPEFLRAFEQLASIATAAGTERGVRFQVHAPLLELSKAQIVLRAEELHVDLSLTHTCYGPIVRGESILACGRCDACRLRLRGFREAGRRDPIPYA